MKAFEQIIEKSSINEILVKKVNYTDNIPFESSEIPEALNEKKIALKYYEGSITSEENENNNISNLKQEKKIYQLIYNIKDNKFIDVINGINNKDVNVERCLWLYFNIDSKYDEIKKYFEMLFVIIYSMKDCSSIKNIAFEAYDKYKNDDLLNCISSEKYLICKKYEEGYNNKYGSQQNLESDIENPVLISDECSNNDDEDWIIQKFGDMKNG